MTSRTEVSALSHTVPSLPPSVTSLPRHALRTFLLFLLIFAFLVDAFATPCVAIRQGHIYSGTKEAGDLKLYSVYECGQRNARDSRYITVYIGGRAYEAEASCFITAEAMLNRLWSNVSSLYDAQYSPENESQIATAERSYVSYVLQVRRLIGDTQTQLDAREQAMLAKFAQSAEQRRQRDNDARIRAAQAASEQALKAAEDAAYDASAARRAAEETRDKMKFIHRNDSRYW